ncbi:MAG: Flp pilus assembly complex ATPase component TadA [Candidatus Omnitrophica bacterium]|nr:Flp pilus assembly complex ATPase component TadA [Candidatus Omnitrophota bacterium]
MSDASLYNRITEILENQGKLSEKDRNRLKELHQKSGKSFSEILLEEKILDEDQTVHLISEALDLPILRLDSYQVDKEAIQLISKNIAERHEIIPIARIGSVLTVAFSKEPDLVILDDLKEVTKCDIRPVLATPKAIHSALAAYYIGGLGALSQVLGEVESEEVEVLTGEDEELHNVKQAVDDAPIVRMVNLIVQEAAKQRASDIHLEPYQDHFRIRYRIDGVLKETLRHSLEVYPSVIARIKILSNLDITEKRVPQDGRFKVRLEGREIDLRVSILPTFYGEKGVLRLLDKKNIRSGLDELGFSEGPIELFKQAIRHPYGMILVTGPTGSGKSTTLYSILNMLNTPDRNLMSIEDPVEYQVEGITQTQVLPEVGLTFANGLRSLLRQSPDVILVGEIRDSETADIAVKAALTGHLVLSTLHTNSAAGAVTRLVDMGVEPFLIASSVIVVAAQRLLRRICPHCKISSPILKEALQRLPISTEPIDEKLSFKGKGCKQCNETGYLGRLGAIEVLGLDGEIKEAVLTRASSEEIEKLARKKGMQILFENAFNLFKTGKTTFEEVLRVTASE